MALEHSVYDKACRDLTTKLWRGAATLAVGGAAAITLLVAPIVVWAHYGSDHPLRSVVAAIAALLLCGAVVRMTMVRYADLWRRDPVRPHAVATPASCPPPEHRTAAHHDRRDPAARPCGPSRCRYIHSSRGSRDVACHATARPLERRAARRRTRP